MGVEWSKDVVEIGNQIAALNPSQATDLLAYMKERYNIVPIGLPQIKPREQDPEKEKPPAQTEFTVVLESFDQTKKIQLVKTYRDLTAAGLKDAMAAINGCPCTVKEGITREEADKLAKLLEESGGKVTVK